MYLISHRGNLKGVNEQRENSPTYIEEAISLGFDVEVDIWFMSNCSLSQGLFWSGHDQPQYVLDNSFIEKIKNNTWFHCKNLNALIELENGFDDINYFWHENDKYTLTKSGHIWTYPGEKITHNSIMLFPEKNKQYEFLINDCAGICSDFISSYKYDIIKNS